MFRLLTTHDPDACASLGCSACRLMEDGEWPALVRRSATDDLSFAVIRAAIIELLTQAKGAGLLLSRTATANAPAKAGQAWPDF